MKLLDPQPKLAERVHKAILTEISEGKLPPGTRIIQEQIAEELGVSRQPVQQALLLLRKQGILQAAPGRGLLVAPLDLEHVRNMYDMRAVIEGLACRKAAESHAEQAKVQGSALIRAGRKAVKSGAVSAMIAADMAFHEFIYMLSGNPTDCTCYGDPLDVYAASDGGSVDARRATARYLGSTRSYANRDYVGQHTTG